MGTTRVFVTDNADIAAQTEAFWTGTPGMHVVTVTPTNAVDVEDADSAEVLWSATGNGPFHVVMVSPDPMAM